MGGAKEVATREFEAESPEAESVIGPIYYQQLMDDIELLDGAAMSWIWTGCRGEIFLLYFSVLPYEFRCGDLFWSIS